MKSNKWSVLLSLLLMLDIGSRVISPVRAQSIGANPSPTTTLAGCPAPAPSFMNFCQVTNDSANPSGAYVTANGSTYFMLQPQAAGGGVTSVFGRTGAVIAMPNDYKYSQISSPPVMVTSFAGRSGAVTPTIGDYGYSQLSGTVPMKPSFSCTTLSLIAGASPPLAAGGCL